MAPGGRYDDPTWEAQRQAITVLDGVESARIRGAPITQLADRTNQAVIIESEAGPTYVQQTDVEMHGSENAVEIQGSGDPGEVGVTDLTVTGPASGSIFRNAVRCDRDNCEFRGLTVDQSGGDYRRALEIDADDCLIYQGRYESTHHPIVVNGDGAWIESVHADAYGDYEALRLNDSSANAKVKNNTLVGGVLDLGYEGRSMYGNETLLATPDGRRPAGEQRRVDFAVGSDTTCE